MIIAILLLIAIIGVGYATLGATLNINGVASIPSSTWNVHFKTGSITPTTGSVTIDTSNNEQAATITNATQVSYAVTLALPGDFYEFTVQVENTGSIDAMIDSVSSKLGTTEITTGTLPSYINYSVAYSDGTPIAAKQLLAASGGTETIRVVNNSTPAACETTGFSETACGFVLEFADVITTHSMNNSDTNTGGWPATSLRTYLNSTIYNALPEQLRNGIVSTLVVSGHGLENCQYLDITCRSALPNFTSTDKMYLLSSVKLWGSPYNDTVNTTMTRQLDYYSNLGVTTSNYLGADKSDYLWWLRTAEDGNGYFVYVDSGGYHDINPANSTCGIFLAFRIR